MAFLHICPNNDAKEHVVSKDEVCWCVPNVQDEGVNAKGFPCQTIIHQPINPLIEGHNLQIQKVWLASEDGRQMAVDATVANQQKHGSIKVAVR